MEGLFLETILFRIPRLSAMVVSHHDMTWYDHCDSYCHSMIMARSWQGHHEIYHDHGVTVMENSHYYNVVRILFIQLTLLISNQVVVHY